MKHCILHVLLFIGLNSQGQDSTKSLSRSSVSFYGGVNRITGFVLLPILAGPWADNVLPGTSVQSCFSFSYNYLLLERKHFSLGIKLGVGYSQNNYTGKIPWEISYGPPESLEQINRGEFCGGVFAEFIKIHKLGWYNQLELIGNVPLYSKVETPLINPGDFADINDIDLHLFYQTGISILINENFTLIPTIGCSLIDVSAMNNKTNQYGIYGYEYIRGGFTATYCFTKK